MVEAHTIDQYNNPTHQLNVILIISEVNKPNVQKVDTVDGSTNVRLCELDISNGSVSYNDPITLNLLRARSPIRYLPENNFVFTFFFRR